MKDKKCITCGSKAATMIEFPCAACGEVIVRCKHCRSVNNPYKCPKCGFEGP